MKYPILLLSLFYISKWSCSRVARQSSAKASTPVRIRSGPPTIETSLRINGASNLFAMAFFITMTLKIIHWLGLASCVMMVVSCYLPWVYFPKIDETFTGVHVLRFPDGNYYGRAGYPIIIMTVFVTICMLIKKIWAKRTNFFLCGLLLAYVFRTYNIFTGSLIKGEVINKAGIYLILICSAIMMVAALFPDIKIIEARKH
jgi:hypothetical protein